MTEYLVVCTPQAVRDLDQITEYIAQNNPDSAEHFRDRLIDRAQSLSNHMMCHGGGWILERPGVRKLIMGNYLILYRIVSEQNRVRVLRFWHGAQDRAKLDRE
ncbi:MAG: hypothetical protein B9S32_16055 [Verrucomicrobia bacterium Tous-C9LFEB]|nr:MAG: hypothetical protein B9S32_16055 [Verrucomicrobia bacterium Tous-C9LFEB]